MLRPPWLAPRLLGAATQIHSPGKVTSVAREAEGWPGSEGWFFTLPDPCHEPLTALGSVRVPRHPGGLYVPWQKRRDLEMLVPGILLLPSATGWYNPSAPDTAVSSRAALAFTHCAAGALA